MRYSIEPRERRYIKGYGFLSFAKTFSNKYDKKNNEYCNKKRHKF